LDSALRRRGREARWAEPFLREGEDPVDFLLFQQLLSRMVGASVQQMVAADKAHVDELANDVVPRSRRAGAGSLPARRVRGFYEPLPVAVSFTTDGQASAAGSGPFAGRPGWAGSRNQADFKLAADSLSIFLERRHRR